MHATCLITALGPLINVIIAPSRPRVQALVAAGLHVPTPVSINLLVDTGASLTSIDDRHIQALGLSPTGTTLMHTPSTGATPVSVPLYDIELAITGHAGAGVHALPSMPVMGCSFGAQGIDGLLGRDLLARGRLIYSGLDNIVMISF